MQAGYDLYCLFARYRIGLLLPICKIQIIEKTEM